VPRPIIFLWARILRIELRVRNLCESVVCDFFFQMSVYISVHHLENFVKMLINSV